MWIFFYLAWVGLIVSAAAHFSTFMGIDPQESFRYIWLLHVGIFVVWLPAIAIATRMPRNEKGEMTLLGGSPKWMQWLTGAAFAYAFVNFGIFAFLMHSGSPSKQSGRFILQDHGRFVRQITEQEYHQYRAYEVRGFSGHWMLFYSAAMTMFASGMASRATRGRSGLNATVTAHGRKGMPLWIHTIFAVMFQAAGFFAGPAIYIAALMIFHLKIGCCESLLWLVTPWPGLGIALYLLKEKLPGTCPECGGRAFWVGGRERKYRCADCGWTG